MLDAGRLGMDLILATRTDDQPAIEDAMAALAGLSNADLQARLSDDPARLAFWINVYNAVVQQQHGDEIATLRGRLHLFRRSVITIAGQALSMDAIEHGILRRSGWKLGLGYVSNPLPSRFERAHRVDQVDPRIHFALNCGAASCPPIAAYEDARVEEQLDLATRGYLASEVVVDGDTLRLPTVMMWFPGDFGGRDGIRRFLADHDIRSGGKRLRFRRYDWSPAPGHWSRGDRGDR